jgi:outer membrane protein
MKRISLVLVALALGFLGTLSFAAPDLSSIKIGVVDLQKIMQTSNQMKAIQQKLEKEFKPRRDKLVAMEASLKADMEKFKRDSAVMSATQKKETEKKIVTSEQQFERDGQQYQQELSTAHNEAMEALYSKVHEAISKVAEKEKFDLILQKDAVPFSAEKMDVTKEIADAIK